MKGIYSITCIPENKKYIGSSVNIKRRWSEHRRELRNQLHRNCFLQLDWDCYGDENFTFEVLEETENSQLIAREHYWTNFYKDNYNIVKDSWNPMREPEYVEKMMETKRARGNKLTFRQKLDENTVKEIITRINKGESDIDIAKDYQVLRGTIWSIKTGNTWKHLHHLVMPQKSYNERRQDVINEGLKLLQEGYSIDYICQKLNRKKSTVLTWKKSLQ
jgi:group I intron endonuclease